jgi:hypothetical protein
MSGFSVNGADLSTIFKERITSPGPTTNFKDSNGNDLNQLFQVSNTPGTSGQDQITYDTSYITLYNSARCDLRYIFQNINAGPVYFSPAENFVLIQSGSSYTLSCKNGDINSGNIVIFNLPISNVVVTLVGGGGGGGAAGSSYYNGGGGGGGGNIGRYTLSVEQSNMFSNLVIGEGGATSGGTGGTTSGTFQGSSGTNNYSVVGGTGGGSGSESGGGGSGGASGWSGGSGGAGGTYDTSDAVDGSDGPSYTISGILYYFGGCGGGGSFYKGGSAAGGLGGGGSGGFGNTGNKNQPYTTPYGTTYPAGSNVFPNTGGGGAGGNGNGLEARTGQTGNSGIIVISFTYP